jgi:YD repeat-containing protein
MTGRFVCALLGDRDIPFAMTDVARRFAVLVAGVVVGCGGDDRPSTAPSLPIVEQEASCSEYDSGSDGSVDAVYTYEYDADGFVVKMTGSGGDVHVSTYDDDHFLLSYTITDDSPAYDAKYAYTRDDYGRVLKYEESRDGAVVQMTVNTHDDRGRILKQVTSYISSAMTSMSTLEFTYKGDSNIPATGKHTSNSQVVTALKYTTSADQRMVHIDYDEDVDGTNERSADYTYDAEGRVLSYVARTGTTVTSRYAYTYNKRGSSLTFFQGSTESGPDDYQRYSTYDAAGMRTKDEARSPSGEAAGSVYTEIYKDQCASARSAPAVRPRRVPAPDPSLHDASLITAR